MYICVKRKILGSALMMYTLYRLNLSYSGSNDHFKKKSNRAPTLGAICKFLNTIKMVANLSETRD